jgi:hypothetical protein
MRQLGLAFHILNSRAVLPLRTLALSSADSAMRIAEWLAAEGLSI